LHGANSSPFFSLKYPSLSVKSSLKFGSVSICLPFRESYWSSIIGGSGSIGSGSIISFPFSLHFLLGSSTSAHEFYLHLKLKHSSFFSHFSPVSFLLEHILFSSQYSYKHWEFSEQVYPTLRTHQYWQSPTLSFSQNKAQVSPLCFIQLCLPPSNSSHFYPSLRLQVSSSSPFYLLILLKSLIDSI